MRIAVVVVAVAVPALAWTASADKAAPAGEKLFSVEPSLPAGTNLDAWPLVDGRGVEQLVEAQRRAADRAEASERELESPASRERREASRAEHVGVSDPVAAQLVQREFGDLVTGSRSEGGLERLAGGRPVAKFLDDHTVVLAGDEDRPPLLVDS